LLGITKKLYKRKLNRLKKELIKPFIQESLGKVPKEVILPLNG